MIGRGGAGDEVTGDLDRRLANVVRKGVVSAVDYATGKARVRIGDIETDWLPWEIPGQNSKVRVWSPLQVGQQVSVSAPSGDLRQGVIGGGLSSNAAPHVGDRGDVFRIEYSDGSFQEYDMAAKTLTLSVPAGGKILLQVGPTTVELTADGFKAAGPRIDLN